MTSIYEQALGAGFKQLHPKIQERFGLSSKDHIASIGEGVMEEIWYARWAALPLHIGTTRHIMFPNRGEAVPFRIENYAYQVMCGQPGQSASRLDRRSKAGGSNRCRKTSIFEI